MSASSSFPDVLPQLGGEFSPAPPPPLATVRMRLLIYSHVFHPSVGGSETAAMLLACGFAERGHEVCVVTQTPAPARDDTFPFRVLRRPSLFRLDATVRWADAVIHSNISLWCIPPVMLHGKPWFVIHHSQIARPDGKLVFRDRLKLRLTRHATNLAVSHAMVRSLGVPCKVMFNPYDDATFRRVAEIPRERDLVFLGRLVPDKGVDVLLGSLAQMRAGGFQPNLTVIGDGPELGNLRQLAQSLGVADQVRFLGWLQGTALANELNTHRLMIVPSMLDEPFGLVTVEGIACGCVVLASRTGGLPEAVGPCGVTFTKGDVDELSGLVRRFLGDAGLREQYRVGAEQHLRRFNRAAVVESYLNVIQAGMGQPAKRSAVPFTLLWIVMCLVAIFAVGC